MRFLAVSAAFGAAMFGSSMSSAGQVPAVVAGIYTLDAERSDNAFEAIDRATADLPDDTRSLARKRLRKSIAVHRIRISVAANRVGITYDAKAPIAVWMGEGPVKWKLIETFVFDVSAKAADEGVSLTFLSDDGERTTTYRNIGDDLLEDTTIVVPHTSRSIIYRQFFTRTN